MHKKKGDTLVEVTLAIGIFSMVAIAVVSVISGSTSGAQDALEVTITREEIDSQAEALRFIHDSYISGGVSNEAKDDKYVKLWRNITARARNKSDSLEFIPDTCANVYKNNSLNEQGAFLINTRALGASDIANALITPTSNVFVEASTYPRIIYRNAADDVLLDQNVDKVVSRAEGIFVIPIKDNKSTSIVTPNGVKTKSAYYDFYIRTCWYAPGADRPSTISTVIRLYDPNIIEY